MTVESTRRDQVERLDHFLREWGAARDADTLVRRLERFCVQAHPLFSPPIVRHRPQKIDRVRLASLLPRLGSALNGARSSGLMINPWIVAGLSRREVRNAAVLASLWSDTQCGKAGAQFLREFLARVEQPQTPLPSADELAAGYIVRTEHCLGADGADRVDLVIESARHLVGIEVKIDAGEGLQQLSRYVTAIERSARRLDKRPAVILLAPFRPSCPEVLTASWPVVRAAAQAVLPPRRSEFSFAHQLIAAFAVHVRNF